MNTFSSHLLSENLSSMIVVAKWKLLSASAFCFLRRSQALISLLAIYGIGGNQRALAETTLGSLLRRCTSPDGTPRKTGNFETYISS